MSDTEHAAAAKAPDRDGPRKSPPKPRDDAKSNPPKRFLDDKEKEKMAKHLAPTIVPTVEMMHAQLAKAENDETKTKCIEEHCIPTIRCLASQIKAEEEEIIHESAAESDAKKQRAKIVRLIDTTRTLKLRADRMTSMYELSSRYVSNV